MKPARLAALALLVLALAAAAPALAAQQGNAFTFQGLLEKSGQLYNGSADLVFRLWDASSGGLQQGVDVTVSGVAVSVGRFSVDLDFGAGMFAGNARWIEVGVRTPGDGGYTTLPRQPVQAAPVAVYALNSPPTSGGGWTTDANGIHANTDAGLGVNAASDVRLSVAATGSMNAGYFSNNSPTYAALAVRNFGTGGFGLYDDTSARSYLGGKLGIGTTSPATALHVVTGHQGIESEVTGNYFGTGYNASMVALGYTGHMLSSTQPTMGLYAASQDWRGVWGISTTDLGVVGDNTNSGNSGWLGGLNEGVYGQSTNVNMVGGRFANTAGGVALRVEGVGQVKTLQILGGADVAERFDVTGRPEPGTVLRIDEASPGALRVCDEAYSRRVAGVVSGANGLDAGVELGKGEAKPGSVAVALTGRVWVKCDAASGAIHAGDLLTTSPRAGHAMRASDRGRAQGAILGKAMTSLETGTGLVLVLVSLQ